MTAPARRDAPAPIRVSLASGEEIGVHVSEATGPEAAPPLLLLPGVSGAGELFESLTPRLARGRRVATIDLPRRFPRGRAVDASVAAVLAALASLSWNRADLLGQSFGSLVAVRAWRRAPDRVGRLVLASPAVRPAGLRGLGIVGAWLTVGSLVRIWPSEDLGRLERIVRAAGGYPAEPDLAGAEFVALARRVRRLDARALFRRLASLSRHDWRSELRDVTAPVLILMGGREVEVLPPPMRRYFETRPATAWRVVPGGHMPFLSSREEFAAAVEAFLAEADPRG